MTQNDESRVAFEKLATENHLSTDRIRFTGFYRDYLTALAFYVWQTSEERVRAECVKLIESIQMIRGEDDYSVNEACKEALARIGKVNT